MAKIIDSLVAHLEARIISGNSRERVTADVLKEFFSDFEGDVQNTVQQVAGPEKASRMASSHQRVETVKPKSPGKFGSVTEAVHLTSRQQAPPATQDLASLTLTELRTQGNTCSACRFSQGEQRSKKTGLNEKARLLVISEPSGRTNSHMVDLFYGEAGDLLWKMVAAMKIDMDDVYMCMAHKCFGPQSREKIIETRPFLERQIELVKPEVILIFGGTALNILLDEHGLMKNRGKWLEVKGVPTIATFPPAYLLQKVAAKREAWSDIKKVMAYLER